MRTNNGWRMAITVILLLPVLSCTQGRQPGQGFPPHIFPGNQALSTPVQSPKESVVGLGEERAVEFGGFCQGDADCVPASCCHSDACVEKSQKPHCGNIMCTMECRPDTLDCGQGRCACKSNHCTARIGEES